MAVKHYGVPYKGSKNKIASWVMSNIPVTDNFYDLFAGGCAITHKALEESKFKNYYANDIDYDGIDLFLKSIYGNYSLLKTQEWISRENFNENKKNPYIRYIWSFGNNGRDYLYGKNIESYKKAWHYAVYFNDFTLSSDLGFDLSEIKDTKDIYQRYLLLRKIINKVKNENLSRLNNFERLQSLQSLNRLQSLQCSFEKVDIKKNSVIYCDIPYINTNIYSKQNFDYNKFYDWAENQNELVIISEYSCPENRFISIAETEKRSLYCATKEHCINKTEKLYIPKSQLGLYKLMMK